MITFESFKIDLTADQWHFFKEEAPTRLWGNPYRDFMQQRLILEPPGDLPPNYPNIETQRAFFKELAKQVGGAVLAIESLRVGTVEGFSTLFKFKSPQHATGYMYLGTLMFTFDRFFCSFQFQADEHPNGTSGTREAAVYIDLKVKGKLPPEVLEAEKQPPTVINSMEEFVKLKREAPVENRYADAEEYDSLFPDHQLSRVRRYMKRVAETIDFDDEVKQAKPFRGPAWRPAQ
jgi:hypothetical protein